ncbi:MAG: CvpA family protein [Patescibacteria group bacterium]|nr:CvpA family protein [Patescibacteria group bacterium]
MKFPLVDIGIIFMMMYFAFKGWRQGYMYLLASVLSFVISFILAIRYAGDLSAFFQDITGIEHRLFGFSVFFFVAFIIEAITSEILSRLLSTVRIQIISHWVNKILGAVIAVAMGMTLISLFAFVAFHVPIRGFIKESLRSSFIVSKMIAVLERYGGPIPDMLRRSAKELTSFITVKTGSRDAIILDISVRQDRLSVDSVSEEQMLTLVNQERRIVGIQNLKPDQSLQVVARSYAKQMLFERFFSHYDKEGNDVSYRLSRYGVQFFLAGENLAYAPDLLSAHEGLMNSEGHRRNILDPKFQRIGIGIIDAGFWGKMVVQVFTD